MTERGSATVWVLAAAAALVGASGLAVSIGLVAVDRHRAGGIADEAALAAASRALQGEAAACSAAEAIADASGAHLATCAVAPDHSVRVAVDVRPSGLLSGLPAFRVRARAGPPTAR